jgi:hypothetical protein
VRESPADRGLARGGRLVSELTRAAEEARLDRGLSYRILGRGLRLSGEQVARICRGQSRQVSMIRMAQLLECVGLELGARAYPGSSPLRDRAHRELLDRLRSRMSPSLRWRLEVPVIDAAARPIDLRAWDATIEGGAWSIGVEAETRVRDLQGLQRRIALKQRDGTVDSVILLLNDTMWHRDLLRSALPDLRAAFPVSARMALGALMRGNQSPGNAIIVL